MGKLQERSPAEASKNLSPPELKKAIRSGDTQNRDWNVARNILDLWQKACQEQARCLFHKNYARCLLEQALITAGNAGTNASVNRARYLGEETPPWQINSRSSQTQTEIWVIPV